MENEGLSCGTLSRILSAFDSNRGSASRIKICVVVPGSSVFDRSYLHASRSKDLPLMPWTLPDPQTHRPRMRQQQEHQQRPDKRHILCEIDPVDLLHLRVVYLPVGVHLERHA